jgi:hypothetical protein
MFPVKQKVRANRKTTLKMLGVAFILNDSTARAGGQVEERNIDQALHVARRPRDMIEIW